MKKETYIKMTDFIKSKPVLTKVLIAVNKLITAGIFVVYPLLLVWLFFTDTAALFMATLVPCTGFVALSVFRHFINRPRPYEKFETTSVMSKDTVGKSFPSRHVFSAFVIAFTFYWCVGIEWLGIGLIIASVILAVMRVVLGVHFISDVLAGIIFAFVVSYAGYILLIH
ncbi:MAG: phosphatase PAP2 family protein [Agathobacter sp.]|nr:phosphatase PAP2 family protein [Agathobacter sp.]